MDFFISSAHAQAAQSGGPSGIANLVLLGLVFVMFYFLLIRPQMKRQKEHKAMVSTLSKGDEVVTSGGVLGKIDDVGDSFVTLEIANNTHIKVQRHAIGAVMPKGTIKSS